MDVNNHFLNKTFRLHHTSAPVVEYVHVELDLSGMRKGETVFFNRENMRSVDPRFESNIHYLTLDGNSIIGDVLVYAQPDLVSTSFGSSATTLTIGGAVSRSASVELPYAAPAGYGPRTPPQFSGAALTLAQVAARPVNYFGHTAAKFPYGQTNGGVPDARTNLKHVGVTVSHPTASVGAPLIESGTLHVILKVYTK